MVSTSPREAIHAVLPALTSDGPKPKILAVDDVVANLVLIDAVLADLGCEIIRAYSGNQALGLLAQHDFALMLLDVQMPIMDGYELARQARANLLYHDIPILFLTAEDRDEQNVLRGYGSGAVDFLYKPLEREVLRCKVRVFLDLYLSRRQVADARDALARSNHELSELAAAKAALAEESRRAKADLEKAYDELKTAQSQLVQSAKMASLGELVAGVAHEINNPLSFSISHLGTVRKALTKAFSHITNLPAEAESDWSRAQDRLRGVELGLERIRALVVQLRTFSRFDEGVHDAVNVREAIESVLMIMQHRLRDRIVVHTEFGGPEVIQCDPSLLNQGVMNLVSNGIDAIESEGAISIAAGADGADFLIRVTDTGKGIPAGICDRVFEPFFTTKPVGHGTGLGLSITYSIVRRHGGSLELQPGANGGTEAKIRIPLREPQSSRRGARISS
jgi:two-component system NtrC family sensor kinase